jgi:hypothetical protein
MRENIVVGRMRRHAWDRTGEGARKEMHAAGMGERGRAGCPISILHPLPRRQIQTSVHCSHGNTPWHQKVPTPFLTREGHPVTWVPCSRYREEREERPGQRVKFQNIL